MFESKSLFGDYDEVGHIWARIYAIDQVSKIRTFQTCSTMQKINPVGCFDLCY